MIETGFIYVIVMGVAIIILFVQDILADRKRDRLRRLQKCQSTRRRSPD